MSNLSRLDYGSNVNDVRLTYDDITNNQAIKISRIQLIKAIAEGKVNLFSLSSIKSNSEKKVKEDHPLLVIEELFKNSLGKEIVVEPNSDYFIDLGGDSLGYISLLLSIEKMFDIHFDLEKDHSLRTPLSFYERIKNRL